MNACVFALKSLQKPMMFSPACKGVSQRERERQSELPPTCPSAGPTGGEGFACPALITWGGERKRCVSNGRHAGDARGRRTSRTIPATCLAPPAAAISGVRVEEAHLSAATELYDALRHYRTWQLAYYESLYGTCTVADTFGCGTSICVRVWRAGGRGNGRAARPTDVGRSCGLAPR